MNSTSSPDYIVFIGPHRHEIFKRQDNGEYVATYFIDRVTQSIDTANYIAKAGSLKNVLETYKKIGWAKMYLSQEQFARLFFDKLLMGNTK